MYHTLSHLIHWMFRILPIYFVFFIIHGVTSILDRLVLVDFDKYWESILLQYNTRDHWSHTTSYKYYKCLHIALEKFHNLWTQSVLCSDQFFTWNLSAVFSLLLESGTSPAIPPCGSISISPGVVSLCSNS